jgi:hypothetical protein
MKLTRIASLLALFTCYLAAWAAAQSAPQASSPEFDHVTRYVRDLQKSADFYDKIMQLSRIPDPFKDGQHIWYRIGAHEQMHLVAGATDVPPLTKYMLRSAIFRILTVIGLRSTTTSSDNLIPSKPLLPRESLP